MTWTALAALAVGAYGFKALGVVGDSTPSRDRLASLIPAALFAGLIVVLTVETDGQLAFDARLAGAAAAGLAAWRRASFIVVVLAAMVATMALRAVA